MLDGLKNTINPVNRLNLRILKSTVTNESLILDYGAGRQQYKMAVQQIGATYLAFEPNLVPNIDDRDLFRKSDNKQKTILLFDVLQHVEDIDSLLRDLNDLACDNTVIVMSYPFLYPICDAHDYHRWTSEGISNLLSKYSFTIVDRENRGKIFTCFIEYIRMYFLNIRFLNTKTWFLRRRSAQWWVRLSIEGFFIIPRYICICLDYFLPINGVYIGEVLKITRKV